MHLDRGAFVVKSVTVDNKHEREVAATLRAVERWNAMCWDESGNGELQLE